MAIKFGTDGWRGIIADDFTFANVAICSQAFADLLNKQGTGGRPVVIGYDTRFASESFASTVAEVIAANGISVVLSDRAIPTPVASYGVIHHKAAGAVMITASHNPPQWNGFKVKSPNGSSADPQTISELEKLIHDVQARSSVMSISASAARSNGSIKMADLEAPYLDHVAHLVDLEKLRSSPIAAIVDSMFGAGAGYLGKLLNGGRLSVKELHNERNPAFPGMQQPEPIAHNLTELIARVKSDRPSVGIATDGDADRLGIVDEKGEFMTQLQVFGLLAFYLLDARGQRGALVKSTTTTGMIFRLADKYGVKAFETPVGFKYIAPVMMANDALIGGEESGGYGFRGHIPERDGILAALFFLDFMVRSGNSPSRLLESLYAVVGPHYYDRIDLEFPADSRKDIVASFAKPAPDRVLGQKVAKVDRSEGIRLVLANGAWVFARLSGTEPIMRIYAESPSKEETAELLKIGRGLAGQ